jgi:hypothetical protein
LVAIASVLTLSACNDLYSMIFGPTAEEEARACGASVRQTREAKSRVKDMRPYAGLDVGRCSVIKDDAGVVLVGFKGNEIAPEGAK